MKEILLFSTGDKYFGLDLPLVRSIHSASLSMIKREKAGMTYMAEGTDIPLCDFSEVLGDRQGSHNPENRKIMLVAVRGKIIALMVDRVERVLAVGAGQIETLPSIFRGKAAEWFPKVLWHEDAPILLLNPEGMGYVAEPVIPEGLKTMLDQIVRKDAVADIMVKGLDRALRNSAARGAARIRDILERHGKRAGA